MNASAHHFPIAQIGEALPCHVQFRCHLRCLGRQVAHLHFERIPFHLQGIARALWSGL